MLDVGVAGDEEDIHGVPTPISHLLHGGGQKRLRPGLSRCFLGDGPGGMWAQFMAAGSMECKGS